MDSSGYWLSRGCHYLLDFVAAYIDDPVEREQSKDNRALSHILHRPEIILLCIVTTIDLYRSISKSTHGTSELMHMNKQIVTGSSQNYEIKKMK